MSKIGNYEAVRKDIAAALKKPDYDDGSLGPVFVRLAWYVDLCLWSGEHGIRSAFDPSRSTTTITLKKR